MSRLAVFESAHPASRFWASKWFKDYGVPFEEDGKRLTVEDTPLNREAWGLVDRLERSYEDVRAEAARQGIEIKPYKPMERHVVFVAMVAALRDTEPETSERYATMLHECVWAQGLPNANHRSTLNLVVTMMVSEKGIQPTEDDFFAIGERFAHESKQFVREKEWAVDPSDLKAGHWAAAERAIDALLKKP